MVGWCMVGTSVRDIPLTSSLTFQATHRLLFLLLTVFASSSVFFLLFFRVRQANQACPVRMASLELLAPR